MKLTFITLFIVITGVVISFYSYSYTHNILFLFAEALLAGIAIIVMLRALNK